MTMDEVLVERVKRYIHQMETIADCGGYLDHEDKLDMRAERQGIAYELGKRAGQNGDGMNAVYEVHPHFQSDAWIAGYQTGLDDVLKSQTITTAQFDELFKESMIGI